jgi:hypothetical protein
MSDYIMVSSPTVQSDLVTKTDYVVYIPLATKDTYGSVKIGDGLKIDYGVVSLDSSLLEDKLDTNLGVENANKFLYVNENGFIDLKYAEQIQYASKDDFPEIGNDKLIYVDLSKGSLWIHTNNEYNEISSMLSIDSDDWFSIEGPVEHKVRGLDFGLDFSVSFPNEKGISKITLSDYIATLRIQQACTLISHGFTSVSDISNQCGYSDPQYFSKIFKKILGESPSEYIKKVEL